MSDWLSLVDVVVVGIVVMVAIGVLADANGSSELASALLTPRTVVRNRRHRRNDTTVLSAAFAIVLWLGAALVIGSLATSFATSCTDRGGHVENIGGGQGETSCEGARG